MDAGIHILRNGWQMANPPIHGRLRIQTEVPPSGRVRGQDVRVIFERADGTIINLTNELPFLAVTWGVDARSSYAKAVLTVHDVALDTEISAADVTMSDAVAEKLK